MGRYCVTDHPFGKWLLQEMNDADESVKSLAAVSGICTKTIYKHIHGDPIPDPATIHLYCYLFGKEHQFQEVMQLFGRGRQAKKIKEFRTEAIQKQKRIKEE